MSKSNTKNPLIRISKRDGVSLKEKIGIRALGILLALIFSGILIFIITKINPVKVYTIMVEGAFGTRTRAWATVKEMLVLTVIAVGLAPAFKMKFWNVGAEGQVLIGGIFTAGCMIYFKSLPTIVLFIIMFAGSIIAGAAWGFLPAFFKAKYNTNETLFTLMMNYVALQITAYYVAKWENPFGSNTVGIINQNTREGWFPYLFGQQYMLNAIIVLIIAALMYVYLKYTKQGYEIAVVGESENTARYAGVDVKKVIIRTMLISGGICGLAGCLTVAGVSHTISTTTAGGRGFTAIIVAWLAKFDSFAMIMISLLLAFLESGAGEIASKCKLNDYASDMVIGIILFFILGSEFFINYKMHFRKKAQTKGGDK